MLLIVDEENTVLIVLTSIFVACIVMFLRWAALPKPIPGIPYNKASAKRLSGDAPDMKQAAMARRVRSWMRDQFALHNSPIVQLFIRPLGRPHVLISDFRESQDILLRRTREFDRSKRSIEAFRSLVANSHISMKSSDHQFRQTKDLIRDLMSPDFLNEVSSPEIYEKMTSLLDLWNLKIHDGNGRPFEAGKDLDAASLDIIMAVAFDIAKGDSTMARQVSNWQGTHATLDTNQEKPVTFPGIDLDPEWQACVYLTQSISVAFRSRLPRISHWLYLQRPYSRRMYKLKEALIARNIANGKLRLEEQREAQKSAQEKFGMKSVKMKCAVDQILLREMVAAEKHGVEPNFHKRAIYDEVSKAILKTGLVTDVLNKLLVYIINGHDTMSSTLSWWVKYIARYKRSQTRLREALYNAHGLARSEGRLPTAHEIAYTSVPYLDAVAEETLRCSHIAPAVLRQAVVDTQILGYAIPKGTDIWLNSSAASYLQPSFEIEEKRRSESAQHANDQREWDSSKIGEFLPERWLKQRTDDHGEGEWFDSQAGPMLAFGMGQRACFGRKLVHLDMKIALTLLVWSFEFADLGEELNSFEVVDSLSQRPRQCYVRLRSVNSEGVVM